MTEMTQLLNRAPYHLKKSFWAFKAGGSIPSTFGVGFFSCLLNYEKHFIVKIGLLHERILL